MLQDPLVVASLKPAPGLTKLVTWNYSSFFYIFVATLLPWLPVQILMSHYVSCFSLNDARTVDLFCNSIWDFCFHELTHSSVSPIPNTMLPSSIHVGYCDLMFLSDIWCFLMFTQWKWFHSSHTSHSFPLRTALLQKPHLIFVTSVLYCCFSRGRCVFQSGRIYFL